MPGEAAVTRGAFEFLEELRPHNPTGFKPTRSAPKTGREPFPRLISDLAPGLKKINSPFVADPSPNGGSLIPSLPTVYRRHCISSAETSSPASEAPHRHCILCEGW